MREREELDGERAESYNDRDDQQQVIKLVQVKQENTENGLHWPGRAGGAMLL